MRMLRLTLGATETEAIDEEACAKCGATSAVVARRVECQDVVAIVRDSNRARLEICDGGAAVTLADKKKKKKGKKICSLWSQKISTTVVRCTMPHIP